MRFFVPLVACVGIALTVAGCNPVTDRKFISEGAGVDLNSSDLAHQTDLLNEYSRLICEQAGPNCGGSAQAFVLAGMNDIDQRCDAYLTWLDARRRDKEPILAELSALNTAAHAIMTVSGSSPKALDIVTAAFGLTSATYNNWNSRLMLAVNQSTVQDIVYTTQGQYRRQNQKLPDQRPADRHLSAAQLPAPLHADHDRGEHQYQFDARAKRQSGGRDARYRGQVGAADDHSRCERAASSFCAPAAASRPHPLWSVRNGNAAKGHEASHRIFWDARGRTLGPSVRRHERRRRSSSPTMARPRPTGHKRLFFTLRELKADGKQGTCSG